MKSNNSPRDVYIPAAASTAIKLDDTFLPRTLNIDVRDGRVHVGLYCENNRHYLSAASGDGLRIVTDMHMLVCGGAYFELHAAEVDALLAQLLPIKAAA